MQNCDDNGGMNIHPCVARNILEIKFQQIWILIGGNYAGNCIDSMCSKKIIMICLLAKIDDKFSLISKLKNRKQKNVSYQLRWMQCRQLNIAVTICHET